MADSRFLDAAIAEGFGLAEFIQRKFPNEPELFATIRPVVDGEHKGFFPAGQICYLFGKDFKRWVETISRSKKHQSYIDLLLRQLNHSNELDLVENERGRNLRPRSKLTIDNIICTSRGGAGGGGTSLIHPRLMTKFLTWCCPQFEVEVIHVFMRFVAGDPSPVTESASIRAHAHENELKANYDDPERQAEIVQKYQAELNATKEACEHEIKAIIDKLHTKQAEKDVLEAQVVEFKADKDKTETVLKLRAARQLELEQDIETTQADLDEEKKEHQHHLDADSGRPLNIFRDMELESIPDTTRHQETRLWGATRYFFASVCVYLAHKNFELYKRLVVDATQREKAMNNNVKESLKIRLANHSIRVRTKARASIRKMFMRCSKRVRDNITEAMADSTLRMFDVVFNVRLDPSAFTQQVCRNNITMSTLLCGNLARIYGEEHSTEIQMKYLAKMALNMEEFTNGDYKSPMGIDYDDMDDLEDVELLSLDD